jgi:hypothetical protein
LLFLLKSFILYTDGSEQFRKNGKINKYIGSDSFDSTTKHSRKKKPSTLQSASTYKFRLTHQN